MTFSKRPMPTRLACAVFTALAACAAASPAHALAARPGTPAPVPGAAEYYFGTPADASMFDAGLPTVDAAGVPADGATGANRLLDPLPADDPAIGLPAGSTVTAGDGLGNSFGSAAIPEPGTHALTLAGLGVVLLIAWRRAQALS